MILVIGGSNQGKLNYALKVSGLEKSGVFDCETGELNEISRARIVNNLHLAVSRLLETGIDPVAHLLPLLSKNNNAIIICNEVGAGIVPIERRDREYRDKVGEICTRLAAEADSVIRIVCGIPLVIKGRVD